MSSKHFQFIQIVIGRRIKNNKNNKGMRKTEGNDSIIEDYIVALIHIHLFNFHSNFHCSENGASRRSENLMGAGKQLHVCPWIYSRTVPQHKLFSIENYSINEHEKCSGWPF